MSGLKNLPGDAPTSRASMFLATMAAIEQAERLVEKLEDGLFGYTLGEVVTARLSLRKARERLTAIATLGKSDAA